MCCFIGERSHENEAVTVIEWWKVKNEEIFWRNNEWGTAEHAMPTSKMKEIEIYMFVCLLYFEQNER